MDSGRQAAGQPPVTRTAIGPHAPASAPLNDVMASRTHSAGTSGYGLRASRAFTWLLAAMSLTALLLMVFGLPTRDPDLATTGTLNGSEISLHTSTPGPVLHEEWAQRWSWARAERATHVVVNSVVFRSSRQNLTTIGTYIEMTSGLLEPTLLALGALAIRGRIKR